MITPENIVRHELIGLRVLVESGSNKTCAGIEGIVVDETRNMIFIEKEKGSIAKIPKADYVFVFTLPDGKRVRVNGSLLVGRPEDRVKKRVR